MTSETKNDLIVRLRSKRMRVHDLSGVGWEDDPDCIAAADTIASLTAENEKLREVLKQAKHEVWNLGLVIGQIAKWPRTYFNRFYVEEWVIRTAKLFVRWGERDRGAEILAVTSYQTKPNKRLEVARNALGGKDD